MIGSRITFDDVTRYRLLQSELHASKQELETAYEELQSTNEELETTNEELQSTVEELETTNEELQSTNEELETMNEELQSTNEELQTMNDEMRSRSTDLDVMNSFLESVFSSLQSAVVVLDREFRVDDLERRREGVMGRTERRSGRCEFPRPRHRFAGGAAAAADQGCAQRYERSPRGRPVGCEPARKVDSVQGHAGAAPSRDGGRNDRSDPDDGTGGRAGVRVRISG